MGIGGRRITAVVDPHDAMPAVIAIPTLIRQMYRLGCNRKREV
jgi:hypothetical protein